MMIRPNFVSKWFFWGAGLLVLLLGVIFGLLGNLFSIPSLNNAAKEKELNLSPSHTVAKKDLIKSDSESVQALASSVTGGHVDYTQDTPLPANEEKVFLKEVETFFTSGFRIINPEAKNKLLSKLNERNRRGARSILNILRQVSTDDETVRQKLALVDYLSYRLQFDLSLKEQIVELISEDVSKIENIRYRGTRIAENAELLEKLAKEDPAKALVALKQISDPVAKKWSAHSAYDGLVMGGKTDQEAFEAIRSVYRAFNRT
jgi:hypothetical protein